MEPPGQHAMAAGLLAEESAGQGLSSGFEIWTPSPAPPGTVNFDIVGSEFSQVLELHLRPTELVTAEPGTMVYMSSGMALDADIGDCAQGLKRCCCAGESMFRLHLENRSDALQKVGLTPRFPAKIVPINLQEHDGLVFNRGAFLAALGKDWRINLQRVGSLGVCCCGGQGLFLNKLHGNGMAFLNAGGTVMMKVLAPGEEMIVDEHSLLAFEQTVTFGIRRSGGFMVCCCAGQGLFNARLTGPGWVMVHTMSLGKLRRAMGGGKADSAANQGGGS